MTSARDQQPLCSVQWVRQPRVLVQGSCQLREAHLQFQIKFNGRIIRMECLISLLTTHPELHQRAPLPPGGRLQRPRPRPCQEGSQAEKVLHRQVRYCRGSSSVSNVRAAGVARRREWSAFDEFLQLIFCSSTTKETTELPRWDSQLNYEATPQPSHLVSPVPRCFIIYSDICLGMNFSQP